MGMYQTCFLHYLTRQRHLQTSLIQWHFVKCIECIHNRHDLDLD